MRRKMYMVFQAKISKEKMWTFLQKGNLMKEIESLRIATQTNVIKTNYIKTRNYNTQQNRKCTLCGDKHETLITYYGNVP